MLPAQSTNWCWPLNTRDQLWSGNNKAGNIPHRVVVSSAFALHYSSLLMTLPIQTFERGVAGLKHREPTTQEPRITVA